MCSRQVFASSLEIADAFGLVDEANREEITNGALTGNPFINNYIGFLEPVGLAEDETGNPNKPILYKSVDYKRLNDKNLFDYYSDFELTIRRRTFIFEETAVLNNFSKGI
jgi:hypothetical protein